MSRSEWGLQRSDGKTLGVAFADYDGAGQPSLYLANDEMPGDLYQNQGKTFKEVGRARQGRPMMGASNARRHGDRLGRLRQ